MGRAFRMNTNRWYTIEFYYQLSNPADSANGILRAWIDGTQIYNGTGLVTCNAGQQFGDCSGIGAILLTNYHNTAEVTRLNGQTLYDNLIVSRAQIGVPRGAGGGTAPTTPANELISLVPGVLAAAALVVLTGRRSG
jgi:hypothetical protein